MASGQVKTGDEGAGERQEKRGEARREGTLGRGTRHTHCAQWSRNGSPCAGTRMSCSSGQVPGGVRSSPDAGGRLPTLTCSRVYQLVESSVPGAMHTTWRGQMRRGSGQVRRGRGSQPFELKRQPSCPLVISLRLPPRLSTPPVKYQAPTLLLTCARLRGVTLEAPVTLTLSGTSDWSVPTTW
jgi:hypothetical protein